MHWQELLVGKQARITPLGLAYDCPLHVSAPGTLHGIDIGEYAPVYFCVVCHRAFPAREMAGLLNVRVAIPPEEPITYWLWRVRGSHPVPYLNDAPVLAPLAKHAVSARDLIRSLDSLEARPEQRRRIAYFLRKSARNAVVFVHTAGYDGVATSLTLARPTKGAAWPRMSLHTGITGFLPTVTSGRSVVFVPDDAMAVTPPIDLADANIAGSPRFTHADGPLPAAVDWRGSAVCAITRSADWDRRLRSSVAVVRRTPMRHRRWPVLTSTIAWMCAVAVANEIGAPVRLRVTLSSRVADILVNRFGWYQTTAAQLGLAVVRDKHTRLVFTVEARHATSDKEVHMNLSRSMLKHTATTVRPPKAQKLLKVISTAAAHVRTKQPELPALLHTDIGGFLLGLVASLSSDPRNHRRVSYEPTAHERDALRELSTHESEPRKEITCAS